MKPSLTLSELSQRFSTECCNNYRKKLVYSMLEDQCTMEEVDGGTMQCRAEKSSDQLGGVVKESKVTGFGPREHQFPVQASP
jgi:hypothetical protein